MNEKAYKAMNFAGVSNIVIGVVVAVVGVAAGVLAIIKMFYHFSNIFNRRCIKTI